MVKNKNCFICNAELVAEKDGIHFKCNHCKITWHREDFNGKMEQVLKMLRLPKNKNSPIYLQADLNAYSILPSGSIGWYVWGIKNTQIKKEHKKNDILFIYKKSNIMFLVKNWKTIQYFSKRRNHCWYYEVYFKENENGKETLILDGEYIAKNEWKGKQQYMIKEVWDKLISLIEKTNAEVEKIKALKL